jgi:hypothetical protein
MTADALSSAAHAARSPRRPIWEREAEGAPVDPVLAAIAAHREEFDAFAAEIAFLKTKRPRAEGEHRKARDAYEAHTDALVSAEIRTPEGLRAFVDYVAGLEAYGRSTIAPGVYAIELWHLSDAMGAVSAALARFAGPSPAA